MNTRTLVLTEELHPKRRWSLRLFFVMALLSFILVLSRSVAQSQSIEIVVTDYETGDPIDTFTFLVNEDNTGDPSDPGNLPSLTPMASHSPVVALGDRDNGTFHGAYLNSLGDGRYLVSVRAAGYKLGGKHFTLPLPVGVNTIEVELVPEPLPLSTIRVHVFNDNQPVNGEDDAAGIANSDLEPGLEGFRVILEDTAGEVTVDWFGNPLCSQYAGNGGLPLPDGSNVIPGSGGVCYTDANGDVIITNLPRGKYEVIMTPPAGQESDWVQTTTIEGTHVIDAWVVEGDPGYSPREGFAQASVWVGFVQECTFGDVNDGCPGNDTAGTGTIMGTVKTIVEWTPPVSPVQYGQVMYKPWVALTNIGTTDQQVYLGRGDENGYFEIPNVPAGTYQLAVWDGPLDYIMGFYTVIIGDGETIDMQTVGVPRWFGWTSGYVFMDDGLDENGDPQPGLIAGNGIRDCLNPAAAMTSDSPYGGGDWSSCERAMDGEELGTRFRDGSIQFGTFTNNDGFYEFPEVKELEKFSVVEVGFGRYGRTGASLHSQFDPLDVTAFEEGALTVQTLPWAGKRSWIDWGKFSYDALNGENGGISGIVFNAVTRNELDVRFAAAEDYEPGVPGVTLNLYQYDPGDPLGKGTHLMTTITDAWEHPSGCDVTDYQNNPLPDPTNSGPNCIEVPNISNEVKDGVFDGGYAFETGCFGGYFAGCAEDPLPPGDYVVEVVPPDFYKVLESGDENTDEGNDLIPVLPPGIAAPNYTPSDPPPNTCTNGMGSGCELRLLTLKAGQNAAADFFLHPDFTSYVSLTGDPANKDNTVMMPGRIFGFALDDVNIETNPDRIYYGEKRGIPNTPIGLRDFTGRLVAMVNSDINGLFEVLLPSGIAADCPTPSGICPNVYKVVVNDPGDPDNPTPNFNPNYQTLTFQFDVWPGKVTFADVATFPITAFTEFPGSQYNQPAACDLPADVPQIFAVNSSTGGPFYHLAHGGTPTLTITGTDFGASQGTGEVTLGGLALTVSSWSDTQIVVESPTTGNPAPGGAPTPGPHQLLITNNSGITSHTGLTIHVRGAGYNLPNRIFVDVNAPDGGNGTSGAPYNVIQDAIDAAPDGALIIVRPGVYYQDITLNKSVKLQGYGPGANDGFGTGGTVIDERFGVTGIEIGAANPGDFADGLARPMIDGFRMINARDGQDIGGGLHVTANGQNVEIGNNIIQSNGGNIGGGIVIGAPYQGDNNNDDIRIHHNRILNNGGISRAGGLGIYNGADNYEIDHNDICGNYSGEYGGGISHFGLSLGGSIHHNRIYRNNAFDEGGGIMIAGEQINVAPGDPTTTGSGDVDIYKNLIQENLSNDDGGGIRLLQPWDYHITIVNNMIVNNLATDLGGGISLDDASDVEIVNNTIARNANTSTAEDSEKITVAGELISVPHGAGVVAELYSAVFASYLGVPGGHPDPVMFNNVVCENQAYSYNFTTKTLLPFQIFDLEIFAGGPGDQLNPRDSLLTDPTNYHNSNIACGDLADLFILPYELTLDAVGFNQEPNFVTVTIVTLTLDGTLDGDYHLFNDSTVANDAGVPNYAGVAAPCDDYDDETRGQHDIGADEAGGAPGGGCGGGGGGGGGSTFALALVSNQDVIANVTNGLETDVVFNHTLHNTGNVADTYNLTAVVDLGWTVDVNPGLAGPVNPGDEVPIEVIVTVPASVADGTVATIEVTAASQDSPSPLSSSVTDMLTVNLVPALPPALIYISPTNNGTIGNLINVRDEDIIGLQDTGDFVVVFDGSEAGIPNNRDLDAFDIGNDGAILMSFNAPFNLAGVGMVDDSDILLFTPTAYGINTAGVFSMYLRGVDVGIASSNNAEDIDGISLREEDQLLISTRGSTQVQTDVTSGATIVARDEDLLLYQMFDAGDPGLGGTFSLYFDGSDIGLGNGNAEDINAVSYREGEEIYLSTRGDFSASGLSGENEDVFLCVALSTGSNTNCEFPLVLVADGTLVAPNNNIDGLDGP